jgi:neutral ceramidase
MRWQNVRGLLAVSVILVFLISGVLPAAESSWKAGIAKAKITPEKPVWMAGYAGRDHPAEGVLHDLWVKALALEAPDGHRAVLLTSDIVNFFTKTSRGGGVKLLQRYVLRAA